MRKGISCAVISLILLLTGSGCDETTVPDTTPPMIAISSPAQGTVVRDTITITTNVEDNEGISTVDFYVDNELLGSAVMAPYEVIWDTKQSASGEHNLQCKATDYTGNETMSDIVSVTVVNYLLKATFTQDWLDANGGEAVIFLSDSDGNLLAENTFSDNDSFEMYLDNSLAKGTTIEIEEISVTTVTASEITTNFNVPVGSAWTWKEFPSYDSESETSVDLDFQNCPEYDGFVLSSKWTNTRSNTGMLTLPYNFSFYDSPQDLFLKLNTVDNGVQYCWLSNVSGGTRQEDLSTMNTPDSHTVTWSTNSRIYQKLLSGFSNPGHRTEGEYFLDFGYDLDNTDGFVTLYYPGSTFSDYFFELQVFDDSNLDKAYSQDTYGSLPDTYVEMSADYNYVSTSVDNFEISVSGDFLQIRSRWRESNNIVWIIYSNKTCTQYSLPVLPNSVTQLFGFERNEFSLWYVQLDDHSELNSYYDILDILFNSDDYIYDVVNDWRGRMKMPSTSALSKQSDIPFEKIIRGSGNYYRR